MTDIIDFSSRRGGKSWLLVGVVEFGLNAGRDTVVLTGDQRGTIERLRPHFPGALFSTVGDTGVRVHHRKRKKGPVAEATEPT